MKKISACPFCGWTPILIRNRRYPDWPVDILKKTDAWTVTCDNPRCLLYDAIVRYYPSPKKAIEVWNNRPAPLPESNGHLEDLRPWQRESQEHPVSVLTL